LPKLKHQKFWTILADHPPPGSPRWFNGLCTTFFERILMPQVAQRQLNHRHKRGADDQRIVSNFGLVQNLANWGASAAVRQNADFADNRKLSRALANGGYVDWN
jgi:hypothetical protein